MLSLEGGQEVRLEQVSPQRDLLRLRPAEWGEKEGGSRRAPLEAARAGPDLPPLARPAFEGGCCPSAPSRYPAASHMAAPVTPSAPGSEVTARLECSGDPAGAVSPSPFSSSQNVMNHIQLKCPQIKERPTFSAECFLVVGVVPQSGGVS